MNLAIFLWGLAALFAIFVAMGIIVYMEREKKRLQEQVDTLRALLMALTIASKESMRPPALVASRNGHPETEDGMAQHDRLTIAIDRARRYLHVR